MAELLAPDPTSQPQPVILTRPSPGERAADQRRQQRDQQICALARQRFQLAVEFEQAWRKEAVEDLKFRAGDQWHADQVRQRLDPLNPRPCLTINQTTRFIRQITNAEQQNRPSIKVRPVGALSDPQTAQTFDGLIRDILYASDWDVALDTAYEHVVTHGRGYWRLVTDYETPWSFQQVIRLERILNPFAVYLDPAGRKFPDYHTANWGFVVERLNRDHLCERYEIPKTTWDSWTSYGDTWVAKDEALVADYYYREELPVLLTLLRNGEVRYVPMLTAPDAQTAEEQQEEADLVALIAWQMARQGVFPMTQDAMPLVQQERRSSLSLIRQCKLVGHGLLERSVWRGSYIPIVPVLGEELDIEGQVDYRGIVRDMKDAQRAYNYWTTMGAEAVALAPKAPFLGTVEQFRNREQEWATANTVPRAYLAYNVHVVGGGMVPPPQRQTAEPPIQAIAVARQQAAQDLYNTSGITPADLGEPSNETSGRHAQIRKAESELGTSHYRAHLGWSVRHTGRILVDLIPHIYSEPGRVLRLLGKDERQSQVLVHPEPAAQQAALQAQGQALPDGIAGIYNLAAGTYDVVIDVGANYQTQRQEAAANLIDLAQAIPAAAQVLPDLIVGLQDFDGAEEAARRLKKTLPPGLVEDAGGPPEAQLPVLQAKLQQTTQEAQALNAHAQQVEHQAQALAQENQQLKGDRALQQAELQLKHRELDLKAQELALKRHEIELQAQVDMVRAQAEIAAAKLKEQTEVLEAREGD